MMVSANDMAEGYIEVIFYVDVDDPCKNDYLRMGFGDETEHIILGSDRTVNSINAIAEIARGEVFLLVGDDVVFKTYGWDKMIMKSLPEDGIALFSFDDGRGEKGKSHPHPAITKKWYETLGYVAWPEFRHWSVDSWLVDISQRINRLIYLGDVLIDHQKVMDKTAKDLRDPKKGWLKFDRQIFQQSENIRATHAEKLKKVIDDYRQNRQNHQDTRNTSEDGPPTPAVG